MKTVRPPTEAISRDQVVKPLPYLEYQDLLVEAHSPSPTSPVLSRPRRLPRDSKYIRQDQAANLLNAWAFYEHQCALDVSQLGKPVGLCVTVQWNQIDLDACSSILQAQGRFLDRMSKFLAYRGKTLSYVWTMEFQPKKGRHSHILLLLRKLPTSCLGSLIRRLPEFLAGQGAQVLYGTIELSYSNRSAPYDPSRKDCLLRTARQRAGTLAYLSKGLLPATAELVGVEPSAQGELPGRRCGASHSLGWVERQRSGWQEMPLADFDFSAYRESHRRKAAMRSRLGQDGQAAWRSSRP